MKKIIVVAFLLLFTARSYAYDKAIMKVTLNTMDKGEHFMLVSEEGDLFLAEDGLKQLGLHPLSDLRELSEGQTGKRIRSLQ